MLDFACDDFSYKSQESAKTFTALLQAGLPALPGIEWVERRRLEQVQQELELNLSGMASPDSMIRAGHWSGAQWVLRGGFSTNQAGSRTLRLELLDVVHAELFGVTNLVFAAGPGGRLEVGPDWASKAASLLASWLPARRNLWLARQAQIHIAFVPVPSSGLWAECRSYLTNSDADYHLVFPGQARAAIEEADLGLLGLSEVSDNAWRHFADFYIWYGKSVAGTNEAVPARPVLQIWDGWSAPVVLPQADTARALAEFIQAHKADVLPHRSDAATGDRWRRAISDSLAGDLAKREELGESYMPSEEKRPRWEQLTRTLEAAAFIDPANARVREAWVRARWNPILEDRAVSHHRFRWLRSDAWAKHVERFGTNSFFYATNEPVGYHAVMSALNALDIYSDRLEDGVPVDTPASVEVQWRREGKARLAEMVSLFYADSKLAQYRVNLLFTLTHDEPSDPAIRARAIDKLLGDFVKDPAAFGLKQWGEPPASNGIARIFNAAGRSADGKRWIEQVSDAFARQRAEEQAATRIAATNAVQVKVPLPRISTLSGLDVQKAFDGGEVDLALPAVNAQLSSVRFPASPALERIRQMAPGRDALWVVGEISATEANPINTTTDDTPLRSKTTTERCMWRVDLRSQAVSRWTEGIGEGEPWCVAEAGNKLWIGLDRGEVMTVSLTGGATNLVRPADRPTMSHGSRSVMLRDSQSYENASSPASALVLLNDTAWVSAMVLNRWNASSNCWVEPLPRGSRGEALTARALDRWLAASPPWLLARHYRLVLANAADGSYQSFQPQWAGGEKLMQPSILKMQPVGDGRGGFWAGLQNDLVWFDATGSNVWRTVYEPLLTVRRDPFWTEYEKTFGRNMSEEFRPEELEALQRAWARRKPGALFASRLPGLVTALAADGDWLWVATAKGETWREGGYRISLMHMPSRRWVGGMTLQERVSGLCAGSDAVWLATEMTPHLDGESPLRRMDKAPWLAVPESRWFSAEVSREEVDAAERRLTPRQQALRSLFRGESGPFVQLYAGQSPLTLDPETLFLLSQAYDGQGLNQPERRLELENNLIQQYPDSMFGRWLRDDHSRRRVRDALRTRTSPESNDIDQRLNELFGRYDENGDGELSPAEAGLMIELEPDQFSIPPPHGPSRPPPGELFVMMCRHHAGPGINREELRAVLRGPGMLRPSNLMRPPGGPFIQKSP